MFVKHISTTANKALCRSIHSTISRAFKSSLGESGFGKLESLLQGEKRDSNPEKFDSSFKTISPSALKVGQDKLQLFKASSEALEAMEKNGVDADTLQYCAAIAGCAAAGRFEEFCGEANGNESGLLDVMRKDKVFPDPFTCTCAIEAHIHGGVAHEGLSLFWDLVEEGAECGEPIGVTGIINSNVVDGSGKFEEELSKRELLNIIQSYNAEHTYVFNAALSACGDGYEAVDVLRRMFSDGVRPNSATKKVLRECFKDKEMNASVMANAELMLNRMTDIHLEAAKLLSSSTEEQNKGKRKIKVEKNENGETPTRWFSKFFSKN